MHSVDRLIIPATRKSVINVLSSVARFKDDIEEVVIYDATKKGLVFDEFDNAVFSIFNSLTIKRTNGKSAAEVKTKAIEESEGVLWMLDDDLIVNDMDLTFSGDMIVGNNIEHASDFVTPKLTEPLYVLGKNCFQTNYSNLLFSRHHVNIDLLHDFVRRGIYRGIDEAIVFGAMSKGEVYLSRLNSHYHIGVNGMYAQAVDWQYQISARENLYKEYGVLDIAHKMWKK